MHRQTLHHLHHLHAHVQTHVIQSDRFACRKQPSRSLLLFPSQNHLHRQTFYHLHNLHVHVQTHGNTRVRVTRPKVIDCRKTTSRSCFGSVYGENAHSFLPGTGAKTKLMPQRLTDQHSLMPQRLTKNRRLLFSIAKEAGPLSVPWICSIK